MMLFFDKTIQCSLSCNELYGYTCQYKSSGISNKLFYHSFYCWRKESFLICSDVTFPLLLTKDLAILQTQCYQKTFYYCSVNILLSFPLYLSLSKEELAFITLVCSGTGAAYFIICPSVAFLGSTSHVHNDIAVAQLTIFLSPSSPSTPKHGQNSTDV